MRNLKSSAIAACFVLMSMISAAIAQECTLHQIASLPMEGDPTRGDGVIVPVKVNDVPMRFFVSISSNMSGLSPAAVKKLGLDLKMANGVEAYSGSGSQLRHYVKLDSFQVGISTDRNAEFLVLSEKFSENEIDGVLGLNYLPNFDIEFDFKGRSLNLFSKDHCKGQVVYWTRDYAEIPFNLTSEYILLVPVTLDGKRLAASLDVQGTESTIHSSSAYHAFKLAKTSPGVEQVSNADGDVDFRYRFKTMEFEGMTIRDPVARLKDDELQRSFQRDHLDRTYFNPATRQDISRPDLYIGMSILSKLRLYFAFKERMLYVSAANAGM